MASITTDAILTVLDFLSCAYPDRRPGDATLDLYLQHLADIPAWLLRRAAEQHICESPWFPKISDLRQRCARLAHLAPFEAAVGFEFLAAQPVDSLSAQAVALEEAFYQEGRLDPTEWQTLAKQFERADRPHRAARTLERLERLTATTGIQVNSS